MLYDALFEEYLQFCNNYDCEPENEAALLDYLENLKERAYAAIENRLYLYGYMDNETL